MWPTWAKFAVGAVVVLLIGLLIFFATIGFQDPVAYFKSEGSASTPAAINHIYLDGTKYISLEKDSQGLSGDERTFSVGELVVIVDDMKGGERTLTADDYSDASMYPNQGYAVAGGEAKWAIDGVIPSNNTNEIGYNRMAHTDIDENNKASIRFTLKAPQIVKRIKVYNRADCCQNRLDGVILSLYNTKGEILFRTTLVGTSSELENDFDLSPHFS